MAKKIALITGVTGQDGSYLAKFLLQKGYEVHGLIRRSSTSNIQRIDEIYNHAKNTSFMLHHGDLTDFFSLQKIIAEIKPQEIYNLAAQSHVNVSFAQPEYTANVNALGTLRILEAIKQLNLQQSTRFYQASTSELFGQSLEVPQKESTPFHPRSPYAISKLFAYWTTVNYREAYGFYACNGILFNHESPLRGENFVTRKITIALSRIKLGLQQTLYLGNLDAKRDWGHARDYVEMQWLMLQQERPEDFVIASGKQSTVEEFVNLAAVALGMQLHWCGEGLQRKAYGENNKVVVAVDPQYFRPAEVPNLLGDPQKAQQKLGWKPRCTLQKLVEEMVAYDLKLAQQEKLIAKETSGAEV